MSESCSELWSTEKGAPKPKRRLQPEGWTRMEREQNEVDDAEHEGNLQEALTDQSKAVKVVVDKWFVDRGYGFGRAPTGELHPRHRGARC